MQDMKDLTLLKSGIGQLVKNELPVYEIISGATLAFAAFLINFAWICYRFIGILLVIPFTRKIILSRFIKKKIKKIKKKNYIDGDYEDISDDNDKKI